MGRTKPQIEDIYRSYEPEKETNRPEPFRLAQEMRRRLRLQMFFNVLTGGMTIAVILTLVTLIIQTYGVRTGRREDAGPLRLLEYAPSYALPPEDRWVLEYRQTASDLEGAVVPDRAPLSVRWVLFAAYHLVSGELALQVGRPQDARIHLDNVLRIFPEITGVRRLLGSAYVEQQQFSRAVPVLRQALKEQATADVLINLGAALAHTGREQEGVDMLLKALDDPAASPEIHKNLALIYRETGATEDAVRHFERYLELVPDDLRIARMFSGYLIGMDRADQAIAMLERMAADGSAPVLLLLARAAADAGEAGILLDALDRASRRMSPRLLLLEINDPVFDPFRRDEIFRALTRRLELETVAPPVQRRENADVLK